MSLRDLVVVPGQSFGSRGRHCISSQPTLLSIADFGPMFEGLVPDRSAASASGGRRAVALSLGVLLRDALRDAQGPGILDEIAHLVLLELAELGVYPAVAHVGRARKRELLGLGLDEGRPPVLREPESHHGAVLREGQEDDPAHPELHPPAYERLAAPRQRRREVPHLVDRHRHLTAPAADYLSRIGIRLRRAPAP